MIDLVMSMDKSNHSCHVFRHCDRLNLICFILFLLIHLFLWILVIIDYYHRFLLLMDLDEYLCFLWTVIFGNCSDELSLFGYF